MKTVPLCGAIAAGRVARVDDEDYELVAQYRWNAKEEQRGGYRSGPYAMAGYRVAGKYRIMMMHKLITGWPRTDHIDHDGLNNQRYNLRQADGAQNQWNSRSLCGTSRYKGVSWDKRYRKWRSAIRPAGVQRHLGYFTIEEDAARAYDAAAVGIYGEFACVNFPGDYPGMKLSPAISLL